MDEDCSGFIEFDEFRRMLEAFHFFASMGKTRKLFNHFDTSGSGSITYQEFVCVIFPDIVDIVDVEMEADEEIVDVDVGGAGHPPMGVDVFHLGGADGDGMDMDIPSI